MKRYLFFKKIFFLALIIFFFTISKTLVKAQPTTINSGGCNDFWSNPYNASLQSQFTVPSNKFNPQNVFLQKPQLESLNIFYNSCCNEQAYNIWGNSPFGTTTLKEICANIDKYFNYVNSSTSTENNEKLKNFCLQTGVDLANIINNASTRQEYLEKCCPAEDKLKNLGLTQEELNQINEVCKYAQNLENNPNTPSDEQAPQALAEKTSTQSAETTEKSQTICDDISTNFYDNCMRNRRVDLFWYCRVTTGIVNSFCSLGLRTIEGLGGGISFVMNTEINAIIWAMRPETYGGFSSNSAVKEVWKLVRDIVNLFLILGLIIVAIATMLKIEKWGWKNTLWKLIVVALLVNFSLIIPGAVLDLSNFLGTYFLSAAKGENDNLGAAILKGFGFKQEGNQYKAPQILDEGVYSLGGYEGSPEQKTEQLLTDLSVKGLAARFILIFFGLLLLGIFAIIVLFVLLIVMILRSVLLIILLSISPLAFAAWIFPTTSKYFSSWWQNFIRWCVFPIILGFLLYVGIYFVNHVNVSVQEGIIASLIQFILFTMFLVVGLWIAFKQSAPISDKILSAVTTALTAGVGWLGGFLTAKLGSKVMTSEAWKSVAESFEKTPSRFFHNLGITMQQATEKAQKEKEKPAKERVEELKNNPDVLRRDILVNQNNQILVGFGLTALLEKRKVDDSDTELMTLLRKELERDNPYLDKKTLREIRPDLYYQYSVDRRAKEHREEIERIMQTQNLTREAAEARAFLNRILELTTEDIKKIDWKQIFTQMNIKGQLGEFLNSAIYNDQTRLTPEELAAIFREMKINERKNWINNSLEALRIYHNKATTQEVLEDLRKFGYSRNEFLRQNLFKI